MQDFCGGLSPTIVPLWSPRLGDRGKPRPREDDGGTRGDTGGRGGGDMEGEMKRGIAQGKDNKVGEGTHEKGSTEKKKVK